jgi:hypothetical protein
MASGRLHFAGPRDEVVKRNIYCLDLNRTRTCGAQDVMVWVNLAQSIIRGGILQ